MNTYYVTVGQRYATESHPLGLHPDGWLEVTATGQWEARNAVTDAIGTKWANLYTAEQFEGDKYLYPRGCLARIVGH